MVTVHLASLLPAFAVITASPPAIAVTLPVWSTLAILALLLLHVTVLSVALSGVTLAIKVSEAPLTKGSSLLLRDMDSTGTTFFFTVTAQVADLPPQEAVIVAVPSFRVVTRPSATVATFSLLLLQVTVLSVASSGFTVAVRSVL